MWLPLPTEINPGYLQLITQEPEVASLLINPKVTIVTDDGRRWLDRNPERHFDAIVSNTTYYFRANVTNLLSANSPDRPNACGCGVPTYLSGYQPAGPHQYLNPAAFITIPIQKASGEQIVGGNLSFNAVRAPGLVNFDASLSKAFSITERFRMRVRADTFNTFNHTNLFGLVSTLGSGNFGQLTQATARTMQLTARLTF